MKKIFYFFIFIIYALFLFFFISLSFYRYNIFQTFFYDFGIFARIIWQLSRFQLPYINHMSLGRVFFLGDHFNPSLILLAPLFWLFSNLKILLVEQALVTVLTGVMIFLIAKKNKLSTLSSFIISIVFLIFAGIENPLVTDWHAEPTAGLFLLLFFYLFSFTDNFWPTFISFFIFLGFKESNTITMVTTLIYLYFLNSKKRTTIIKLGLICIAWFLITTKIIIPLISKQPYFYSPDIPKSIIKIVTNMFNLPIKRQLVFNSFISFGFLPLFSFGGLIPIIGEFAIRFIPDVSKFQSYTLAMHYNVYLGIFLALTSIYAIINIKNRSIFLIRSYQKSRIKFIRNIINVNVIEFLLVMYLLLIAVFSARKITWSPINMAINKVFWQQLKGNEEMLKIVDSLPKKGVVMSQNNILSHLVARNEEVYFINRDYQQYKPDIIVFDLFPDQNINNIWGTDLNDILSVKESLLKDPSYTFKNFNKPNLYVFLRK